MTNSDQRLVDEARQELARVRGELTAVGDQLAASVATELHIREELQICRSEAAVARAKQAHVQRRADDRSETERERVRDPEDQLSESRRIQHEAERDRAWVHERSKGTNVIVLLH
jgi:tmRNA-binding protein